ncbi:MAG: HD domain-containing protein [Anaeroplasma sp.]|uniref:HD-GYP domain-containing protein n=1 Tax=Anaeroplasma sp. TaxID=1872523 RepID=UPI002A915E7A|nr:HD domain-containing phosphohydrolase [Anaeroplasma sp.]MDY5983440.1 HD domain-containing protein [Anaeroplasma sp.]
MESKYYNENYYNANTILKFLRKVLNEINKSYVDSGMRTAFLMKRYLEKYKLDTELSHQHVLLCMLKDIGLFYMDGAVPTNDPALAAASSYAFLHQCSPLGEAARPLLFYKAKYMEDVSNPDYEIGLLMTLLDQVSLYIYERKDIEEIEEILREDKRKKKYHPDQVKKVIKLLKDHSDIIEKLNSESELYVYETSKYISLADYGTDTLGEFLDTTSFMFEFHNHETMAHTVTTAQIAYDLAISCKLTESTSRAIEIAGKVHDIGKIRVPLEILCYPGKLEGEALAVMQSHAKYTKEIIEGCFSYVIVEIAARHHEKLDGSGYPLGITKKDLTSADKVLAVADICSALYCKRSYKAAFTPEKIQSILLSDAKAGKLDERIVNHLIDDYDNIMKNAKAVEDIALKKYDTMKDEYEALAKSPALRHVFGESEDIDEERPESVAADETEEYISGVINYESKKDDEEVVEKIIYVDENGNEIDYNKEAPSFEASYEEEKEIDPLEEYNQAEMGDVPIEEIDHEEEDEVIEEKEEIPLPIFNLDEKLEEEPIQDKVEEEKEDIDDEFDAFLNSIPEKAEEEPKKFVPKVPLKNPMMDFDPFKEDIDPVFQEPILPKEEKKEDIDDEFDAFLNSIPEIDEKNDSFMESTDSKEKLEDAEETQEKEEEKEEVEALVELEKEEIDTVEEAIDTPIDIETQEEKEEDSTEDTEESVSSDIESEEVDDASYSDEDEVDDSTLELDTLTEESNDEEINSKYDDLDEEVDNFIEEAQEEKEKSSFTDPFNPSSDGKKSFFDEEIDESALEFNDKEIDSKYDNDEDVDDSIEDIEELDEEDALDDSKEEPIDSFDLDIEDDSINNEEENLLINSKYDDLDEEIDGSDSILEDEESKEEDNSKDASKEEEYVDSYFTEEELKEDEESIEENDSKEVSKEEEYVSSYFTEEELKEDEEIEELSSTEEPLSKEDIKPIKEEDPKEEYDGELDMDLDEDDDDEEDDDEDLDEEEEEDSNPKHKKFFSNDIYRKMFTYNPNKKKK